MYIAWREEGEEGEVEEEEREEGVEEEQEERGTVWRRSESPEYMGE